MNPLCLRTFTEPGIRASVSLAGADPEDCLEISPHRLISIPKGVNPTGFQLALLLPKSSRSFVVQKSVGQKLGAYHDNFVSRFSDLLRDEEVYTMNEPIEVMRVGKNVWTSWHQDKTNRLDCWHVGLDGLFNLFQVGVITHDDGLTWHLHGEYRWRGKLFQGSTGIVAKPEKPKWGVFGETWQPVFVLSMFKELLQSAELQDWNGKPEELDPPLPSVSSPGFAVMQWYVPFAGQTGQGIAILHPSEGKTAWVHGIDVMEPPDADGVKRLVRGDVVSFAGRPLRWGNKPGAPPKLVNVRKVS